MACKYTIEEVKKIFKDQGCELLSKKYKTVHDKLDYRCICGEKSKISLSSFLNGCRCKKCGNKKRGNNVKYSLEQVKKIFKDQGCELLSKEYKNARDVLDHICSCGNVSKIRLTHFLQGHRCKKCGHEKTKDKLRFLHKDVEKIFEDNGCKLLSKKYVDYHSHLDYECSCGEKSKISLAHFLGGERCKKCGIKKRSGKNNSNYNPNLTDEERINRRKVPENGIWTKDTLIKNDYTCQKCFQRGGTLNAHHILNYATNEELRFDDDNGITLCKKHHIEFHKKYGYRNNTREQLEEFLGLVILA